MAKLIVVVDDAPEILELYKELLTDEGYDVRLYSAVDTVVQDVQKLQPDLLIVDFLLGGSTTGWQLIQRLTNAQNNASMPIILSSGACETLTSLKEQLLAAHVQLLPKPFDIDNFLVQVKNAVEV